ncbi:NADPH:quinone oxidoreductase family protein [Hwanghaeella sp.]|uniref:NADPH:quinone oxidoreductase family protein n=1 Tax=Hwanghaeella sp. TaxID=2605943 RepID=UPI003CCBD9A6
MKAVRLTALTGFDAIRIEDVETRPLASREVRIKVHAAGLNFADLLMAGGTYQATPEPPFTMGMELAGEVVEVHPDADGVFPGDRVMARPGQGAFAEEVVTADRNCIVVPPSMSFEHAAAFPIAYGTAHLGLSRRGRLKSGEVLMVHGAAGGVGLTAVQVGKAMGATVIATAGSDERLAIAKANGADFTINYRTDSIRDRVKEMTGGVDVVFDPVGGDAFKQSLRCINPEGRIIVIGFASGDIPQAPANILLVKNVDVIGFYWGGYGGFAPEAIRNSLEQALSLYGDGLLTPHVSHVLPFDRVQEAFALLRDRKATGKVLLTPA